MRIAFLGLGKMGTAMACRLVQAGHELVVWNRTSANTEALAELGATAASTPQNAIQDAQVVMTMLFDDAAYQNIFFQQYELLDAMPPGILHIASATISVELSKRLTEEHHVRNHVYIAAPVFGRPNIAAEGRLWTAVAGPENAIATARPLLETFSRGISVVGSRPFQAHALKLGGNFLISAMLYSLSEAFVYANAQGIEPAIFFETVNSALFQSPFYAAYASVMLHPPAQPGATMELGAKDIRLLIDAANGKNTHLGLADTLLQIFQQSMQNGLSQEDWAAGMYTAVQVLAERNQQPFTN